MAESNQRRFLLGKGETLAENVAPPKRQMDKAHVYGLGDAKAHLSAELLAAVSYFDTLPDKACPDNEVTAMMVLHPGYIAKSYWPSRLIDNDILRSVGSKPLRLVPRKIRKTINKVLGIVEGEKKVETVAMFVAGSREAFHGILKELPTVTAGQPQRPAWRCGIVAETRP